MLEGSHEVDEMIWCVRSEDRNSAVRAPHIIQHDPLDPDLKEAKKHFKHWNSVNVFKHVCLFVCFTSQTTLTYCYVCSIITKYQRKSSI